MVNPNWANDYLELFELAKRLKVPECHEVFPFIGWFGLSPKSIRTEDDHKGTLTTYYELQPILERLWWIR